ncbi:MAG: hypothetical protein Kow0063_39830 [Anaerolineae bacterium]
MSRLNSPQRPAWKRHWPDIAIIVMLALLPALFFWRLIAPNPADRMNIPAGDFTGQYYPLRLYAAREISAGRLPLWNPSPYGGQPALADIQSGALYPPQIVEACLLHWLGLGFPVWALELQAIAHFSWAAIGAYLLGKRLAHRSGAKPGHARFAGLLVSLVFTYSGYLTGFPVQQLTILEVSAWAPWVLLGMDLLATRSREPGAGRWLWRTLSSQALAGLLLGLSLLPGHPQTSLYVVYLAVAYYFFRVLYQQPATAPPERSRGDRRLQLVTSRLLPAIRYLLPALLPGFALAAAQLLPTLEFIAHSSRSAMTYEAVSFGLPIHELVSLIYPGYFGGSPIYIGILPMILVGLALALGRPRGQVAFWAITGLLGLLLALGDNTFLYPLFYLIAPGFDAVRHQERAFLVYALSAAVLSGYGALLLVTPLDRMRRLSLRRFERGLAAIFGAALALTALFLYGWVGSEHADLFGGVLRHHVFGVILLGGCLILLRLRPGRITRRPWGMVLMAGWIVFNLFSINWRFNLEQPGPTGPYAPTPLTEFLRAKQAEAQSPAEPIRIASAGLLPGGPGAASVYGLQDITGNTPLRLASLETFEANVPEWRRWQLLNVHYVLSDRDLDGPGLTRIFPAGAPADGQVRVYAMGDPFPRAWVVHAVEVIPDQRDALARLSADEFDLRRVAVVAEPPGLALSGAQGNSTARVTAFAPHRVTVEVDAAAPGLLVLSEIYYPGWRASLDGQPVRLIRSDAVLRGIPVPQGRHIVQVWYTPLSARLGLVISGLALVVIIGFEGWYIVRNRRSRGGGTGVSGPDR